MTLKDQLLNEETRPALAKDCCAFIDDEVRRKRGASGLAIRAAYKTVKTIKRGFVPGVVNALLDEWVAKLEPYYAECGGDGMFSDYLADRPEEVAQSLLEVTDGRAEKTKHKTAKKLYFRLRPKAKNNVSEAVPRLGLVMQKYL